MIEADNGYIEIDGTRTDKIGLHQLREKIAIIPQVNCNLSLHFFKNDFQEPVLFSGTLRFNLDPFNRHSDEQIWKALDSCQLKTFVSSQSDKLDFHVSEGGKNMR